VSEVAAWGHLKLLNLVGKPAASRVRTLLQNGDVWTFSSSKRRVVG